MKPTRCAFVALAALAVPVASVTLWTAHLPLQGLALAVGLVALALWSALAVSRAAGGWSGYPESQAASHPARH